MKALLFLALGALCVLLSCTSDGGGILTPRYFNNLADAEVRWKAHNFTQYTISQRRSCFCIALKYPLILRVENGRITSLRDTAGDTVRTELGRTVEQIFSDIRSLQGRADASFIVQYDSVYGYPRYLSADPIKLAVDDEYVLETRLVR